MMPRITQPDPKTSVFYAVGYGGNGVSSAHAGRPHGAAHCRQDRHRLPTADRNSPLEYPNLFNTVSCAFAPFRRFGQRFLYHWYYLQDEKL